MTANGASVSDDAVEDEEDDLLPLSGVFPTLRLGREHSRERAAGVSEAKRAEKRPPTTGGRGGASAPEGGRSRCRSGGSCEEDGDSGCSMSGRRGAFALGDIVWAKAFPYTWWPGCVRESRGSLSLVSFYGGDKSRWFEESSIRGFEENYLRMSKMGGARLACRVDCALAELSRRTALEMACSCRCVVGRADEHLIAQADRERERFEPAEMLEFVLSAAVRPWVGDGETISAVRAAAQVNAYRCHVSVAQTGTLDEGFQPGEVLDIVRCLAVSSCPIDAAAAVLPRVVSQLDAYRHFTSPHPDWVYQSSTEEWGSSASEDSEDLGSCCTFHSGSDLESPFRPVCEIEETVDLDYLYENDTEEQDERMHSDGEFCVINRIDYSILSSNTLFEHLFDNKSENVHNWSGEKGLASDNEKMCDVSHLSGDQYDWNCNFIHGSVSSDSGQILSSGGGTSEGNQDDEFHVVNALSGEIKLSSNINFDRTSFSTDCADGNTSISKVSCRYAHLLDRFHGRVLDQTAVSEHSVDVHRTADFSLTDAPASQSVEFRDESNSQYFVNFSLKSQVSILAGMFHCEEVGLQYLHEMLCHLHCLASDQLYMTSENLLPLCQLLLIYRASTFQNISGPLSMICDEANQKAQELDVGGRHHLTYVSGEEHQDDKVADICQPSRTRGKLSHICDDGIDLWCGSECQRNLHMPHATEDGIIVHSCASVNVASKTVTDKKYTACGKSQSSPEKRLSGKILVDKRYTAASSAVVNGVYHSTFPVNRDCEVITQRKRFSEQVAFATSSNLHIASSMSSDVKASKMSRMLGNKNFNDRKAFYIKQSDMSDKTEEVLFQENATNDTVMLQSNDNICAAANASDNNTKSTASACTSNLPPICRHEVSSIRKRRPDQLVYSYISKWQKRSHFTPLTLLYASPLVKDSPRTTSRHQCSQIIGRQAGPSISLHMKFPRGFNLPSKEDLEKIFSLFGPLDHSRTRIFFYTGAGKVVFLNPVDAETAYKYVIRNKVFETDMRFWLIANEKAKKLI